MKFDYLEDLETGEIIKENFFNRKFGDYHMSRDWFDKILDKYKEGK